MEWNKFPQQKPTLGKDYLIFDSIRFRIAYFDYVSSPMGNWYDTSTDYIIGGGSHWAELPEKPKDGE